MRRGVGISGLQRQQARESHIRQAGAELGAQNAAELRLQLDALRARIEAFAREHRGAIDRDPLFRAHFNAMCAASGVDPLVSSKGVWAQLLGVGDFYYELAVQVADVCIGVRAQAGGLIALDELHARVRRQRGASARALSVEDVLCAVGQLRQLGGGYEVLTLGGRAERYVRSVPHELNDDHNAVLALAMPSARVTRGQLEREAGWSAPRADEALGALLQEGIVWLDAQAEGEPAYWAVCIWERQIGSSGVASGPADADA